MFKCETCGKETESLRGWSRHQSMTHKIEVTSEMREAAIASASADTGAAITGNASLDEAAINAPTSEAPPEETKSRKPRKKKEPDEADLRLQALKKTIAGACTQLTLGIIKSKCQDLPSLTVEEIASLNDGWNAFFDSIGVTFAPRRLDYTITSPWAMLLMPALAVITIFSGHLDWLKAKLDNAKRDKDNGKRDHRAEGQRENDSGRVEIN